MQLRTRLELRSELNRFFDVLLGKGKRDDSRYPVREEADLRATLTEAWDARLRTAMHEIHKHQVQHILTRPSLEEVDQILGILKRHLSGSTLTSLIEPRRAIRSVLELAHAEVDLQYHEDTGKSPLDKAEIKTFGLLFGLTEDHALEALARQTTLSAGGLWEKELSDSMRQKLEDFFAGDLDRGELRDGLEKLVNEGLEAAGAKTKAGAYFDGLAEHMVVRTRAIGGFYRAKALNATSYTIENPQDRRTSQICKDLEGVEFPVKEAEDTIEQILTAESVEELKENVPFLNDAKSAVGPVPPLHWRCRSWIAYKF